LGSGSQSANNKYFYDIAGNLTSNLTNGKIKEYYYNAQNKLVKITGSNFVYEFSYDSQNRRIGIGNGTNNSSLIWRYTIHDGNLPIAEFNTQYEFGKVFVRGIGIAEGTGDILAEIDSSGNAHYYLPNHRGDTLLVLDEDGAIESKIRYDAFGNVKEQTGTFSPTYTFSTKEYISDAKLYLYAYRVYDPIAGRWTQRDPIDYQDSINLYQFCGNNPVNKNDPDGQRDGGNYFTHSDPDYSYNWKTENRFNSEVAYDGAPMFAPEAAIAMVVAVPAVIGAAYAGPAIVAAGVGVLSDAAYVGIGLSWMTGSF